MNQKVKILLLVLMVAFSITLYGVYRHMGLRHDNLILGILLVINFVAIRRALFKKK